MQKRGGEEERVREREEKERKREGEREIDRMGGEWVVEGREGQRGDQSRISSELSSFFRELELDALSGRNWLNVDAAIENAMRALAGKEMEYSNRRLKSTNGRTDVTRARPVRQRTDGPDC